MGGWDKSNAPLRRANFVGTKNCGGETPVVERFAFTTGQEARAGREFLSPQPPFLPAPPERKSFLLCRPQGGN